MVGSELDDVLHAKYADEPAVTEFHDVLTSSTRARRRSGMNGERAAEG